MKRSIVANNKVCPICSKVFAQKSNRDRHVKNFHSQQDSADGIDNVSDEFDNDDNEQEQQNQSLPSMVFSTETIQPKVLQSLPTMNDTNPEEEEELERTEVTEPSNENTEQKQSRLEMTLLKIKQQLDYSMNVTESVLEKLKRDFKDNQNGAVKFILDCFDEMVNDDGFIAWLAKSINYKPCRFKQILNENKPNNRNSKFTSANFQEIFEFWLDKCINSNESAYNVKRITKRSFLEQYSNIKDSNIIEKIVQLKKGSKKVLFTAPRMVYIESARKLHSSFCEKYFKVSKTLFFKCKPYYCVRLTEKEKSSCLCINCLNPHLLLQSINIYGKSKHLPSHNSLTAYIDQLQKGEIFEEANDDKPCKFYSYQKVVESHIGNGGKPIGYTRTSRIDYVKPVMHLVSLIKDGSKKYKKHRSYVDNCSSVYPMMKDAYSGKFIELDFSQNLALRPKLEVQSAHFSNKQYTLHCAIATPFDRRYHYHLSDDTKHDGIFVDHVLRDLIANYNISNEDLWVQSDNASSQYKKKQHSFGLLQSLANEFNLRIIRT